MEIMLMLKSVENFKFFRRFRLIALLQWNVIFFKLGLSVYVYHLKGSGHNYVHLTWLLNFGIIHIQNWLQIPLYTKCLIKTWLSFLDPSKIDQAPSNKTMVESNNITLHCNATGNPAPNITWTKDGKQTVLHHGEEYTITNISRHQHGSYKCAAWNNVGQVAKSSFSINVLCKQVQ